MNKLSTLDNIVIATGNTYKFTEIKNFFLDYNITGIEPLPTGIEEPIEDGVSFTENAALKAKYYGNYLNRTVLSDDSGLVIPDIDNQPGIYSARWAGINKDFKFGNG